MRIVQVGFKNLNSLVGEWEIDLTHPLFLANGIFAITGPTGAGKTTLLDAICLALYGSTPRLGKITKNSNEIISRRSGECFASVTFETQAGRYRCHWSQHRARQKADGELQAPKHEIANATSGQIIEASLRGVEKEVEQITGMNFDRFTRSMLLAQGAFAAFLQTTAADRSEILEQITGTTIYTEISKNVHIRRGEEQKKADLLSADLARMTVLSSEEAQQQQASLAEKGLREATLTRELLQTGQAMAWLEEMAKLAQAIQEIERQQEDWRLRQEGFAPKRAQLKRANQALELAADHGALNNLRAAQRTDQNNHAKTVQERLTREAMVVRATERKHQAARALEQCKQAQKEGLLVIQQVRGLDVRLEEKKGPIQTGLQTLTEQEKACNSVRATLKSDSTTLEQTRQQLSATAAERLATQQDAGLVESLAGISNRIENLHNQQAQRAAKEAERAASLARRDENNQRWQKAHTHLLACQQKQQASQQSVDEVEQALTTMLGGSELSEWRQNATALHAKSLLFDSLKEAVRRHEEAQENLKRLAAEQDRLQSDQKDLAAELSLQRERESGIELRKNLLEKQVALLRQIQDLEGARHQLQAGEPCPLCGATVHPFASGHQPPPDAAHAELEQTRQELKTAHERVIQLGQQQIGLNKDLEHLANHRQQWLQGVTQAKARIAHSCQELGIVGSEAEQAAAWPRLQAENSQQWQQQRERLQTAEALEKKLAQLRPSLAKLSELTVQAERAAVEATHQKARDAERLAQLEQEAIELEKAWQQQWTALQQLVVPYGVEIEAVAQLGDLHQALTRRRDQWQQREKRQLRLTQEEARLTLQTEHQQQQIRRLEENIQKQREQLTVLQQERNQLQQARQALLGDKSADAEENRLTQLVAAATGEWEQAQQGVAEATRAVEMLVDRLEALQRDMTARTVPLQQAEADFSAQLERAGFKDEPDYLAAVLPEERRKELLEQAQQLTDEQTALTARERDKQRAWAEAHQHPVTEQTHDTLSQQLADLQAQQRQLQQEMGAIRQTLTANAVMQEKRQEYAQRVAAQQRECERWEALHGLIGSVDGKKYRNFAQGLTFDRMIGHANQQLQKMSDRYLLIRDMTLPLELNVIDTYQAGEIRSSKNLSGGESFLVSLALALGLSHMASNRVRVDSLFLDEGFGTLDEEALEMALATLAALHREGKLIGIISHVPALKERIQAQIEVTPQTGGRSRISGPGCRKVGA